jgi:hypothetical protein
VNRDGQTPPDQRDCILCRFVAGAGCPHHPRRASRLLRAASLLLAAITLALAVAGCQTQTARPSGGPTSFWPCPAGQAFTEHHQVCGCYP